MLNTVFDIGSSRFDNLLGELCGGCCSELRKLWFFWSLSSSMLCRYTMVRNGSWIYIIGCVVVAKYLCMYRAGYACIACCMHAYHSMIGYEKSPLLAWLNHRLIVS